MSGNETSAIGGMRAVNTAEVSYSSACGNGAYAVLFTTLGVPPPGGNQAFLSEDLSKRRCGRPQKSGYTYTLAQGMGGAAGPERLQRHGDRRDLLRDGGSDEPGVHG